jgi:hypothetical protein
MTTENVAKPAEITLSSDLMELDVCFNAMTTSAQKALALHAAQLNWFSLQHDRISEVHRQTGRTQVLAVAALRDALRRPNVRIPLKDHAGAWFGGNHASDRRLNKRVRSLLKAASEVGHDVGRFSVGEDHVVFTANEAQSTFKITRYALVRLLDMDLNTPRKLRVCCLDGRSVDCTVTRTALGDQYMIVIEHVSSDSPQNAQPLKS